MKKEGYYSSGQFAALAGVSVRTIRFYDKLGILKPSLLSGNNARFYTDSDLVRLQQILLLKYLGFSLEEIRELTIDDQDPAYLLNQLDLQQRLVEDRIEQMQVVRSAISDTAGMIREGEGVDWSKLLDLIHLTGMENALALQYKTASNLSARIRLHALYSVNKQGWFPWLYSLGSLKEGMRILELGCGSGSLWIENMTKIPSDVMITLSDISDGMIRDARRGISLADGRFQYAVFDCNSIPYPDESFDLIYANHVLFYVPEPSEVCREAARVLKKGGRFICSTYGRDHMIQISQLVSEFDQRIVLSANRLYDRFGLENGRDILSPYFDCVSLEKYEDRLLVDSAGPLIEYIISCHGNQNQYILDRYKEFRSFVRSRTDKGFEITKSAGAFIACKE